MELPEFVSVQGLIAEMMFAPNPSKKLGDVRSTPKLTWASSLEHFHSIQSLLNMVGGHEPEMTNDSQGGEFPCIDKAFDGSQPSSARLRLKREDINRR